MIASAAQFIERNLDESDIQAASDMISPDKSRLGRDQSGPYRYTDEGKMMEPKPERFGTYYAEAFKNRQVVDAYRYRPPYPAEVFDILTGLISDELRTVLDVGAGSGTIARNLVRRVERVDAIDFSQNMIEEGEQKVVDFDCQVRAFLSRYHSDGMLPLQVVGTVTWGKLLEGNR